MIFMVNAKRDENGLTASQRYYRRNREKIFCIPSINYLDKRT